MATSSINSACCLADGVDETCPRESQCTSSTAPTALLDDGDVKRIIERKLAGKSFRVVSWSLDRLPESNGFMGQYFNLSVTVSVEEKREIFKFFAKTPPPKHSVQYDMLTRFDTFTKEILAYTDIFAKMGMGRRLKWSAECYLEKKQTIIVLEDACDSGYANPNKYVPFNEEQCVWIVRTISTFHSRSLILDEKLRRSSGRTVSDLYGHLLNEVVFLEKDDRARKILYSCVKGGYTLVDFAEGLTEEERAMAKSRIERWLPVLPKLLGPSAKYRNVICHRDMWANNIMFKQDSGGKLSGCYLVDFQFLRYCPPAIDFTCVLYLTTDRATRERHFDSLLALYHDTMRAELASEGLDVEECLPWSEFVESCKELRKTGLVYAATNLQIMLLTAQAVEKYFEGPADVLEEVLFGDRRPELVSHQCQVSPEYRKRNAEVIAEILERLPEQPPPDL